MPDIIFKQESFTIIGAAIEVHKTLGNGFLEAVYQEALAIEFKRQNIPFEQEKELRIRYKNDYLKKRYFADFVCYEKIIVECKALPKFQPDNEAQAVNYLYATEHNLGLLLNFGSWQLGIKRVVNLDGKMKMPAKGII